MKAEGSSHEVIFLVESLFSQSNSFSYITRLILSKANQSKTILGQIKCAVLTVFWLFLTNGTLYQSAKTLKTIVVPIVAGLPRLYQLCTNRQKQSKDSKYDHWCTNRHMSILECTNSVTIVYQSSTVGFTGHVVYVLLTFVYKLKYSYF